MRIREAPSSTDRGTRTRATSGGRLIHMGADDFLGLSSTAWTGVYTLLTAGLVVAAGVAARYAKKQWESARAQIEETRRAGAEATRPYVIVTVEPSEASRHLFDLVLRNIGQRPAMNVRVKLDPPPVRAEEIDGHELANAKMLNEPVAMVAPGQEMRAFYDSHIDRYAHDDLPTTHRVSLDYKDTSGHSYSETSVVDIDAMRGTTFTDVKTVHDIGKSLEAIQQTLDHASVMGRHGGLEVEASVERRADQEERVASERAEAGRQHDAMVRSLLPGTEDGGEAGPTE